MKVIVGHENLDLDALGAMALARYLHPGAVLVQVGGLEGRMQEAVNLYADHLGLLPAEKVPLPKVREVVVVDTQRRDRIGPFAELVGKVPFVVYDHHPPDEDAIPAAAGAVRQVGAATTVVAELLAERGHVPGVPEAELGYAGILEDTGRFTYAGTTPSDLKAAAWLLEHGADPVRVRPLVEGRLAPEAKEVLEELLATAQAVRAGPYRAVIAEAKKEGYVPALAPLAHTVADLFDADAVFLLFRLGDQRLVIARSRRGIDVERVLKAVLGRGGGHPRAAFARVELPLPEVRERLARSLVAFAGGEPTLAERMTPAPEALPPDLTVRDALARMKKRGYGGMPVLEGGRVLGVLRRRDLERAELLGLGDAPAKGFLHPPVMLPKDAPLALAERALKEGAGRVLVTDGGRVVGIFTRTDLYQREGEPPGLAEEVLARLPAGARKVLEVLAARFPKAAIYLVGGAVRDALLGEVGPDLDLVIEGVSAERAARALAEELGGEVESFPAFATARVRLSSGTRVDLANPREERYPRPGALPEVRPSTLERDLRRRDFTVNAMALRVHPGPPALLDPYGGLSDLREKRLKPLSPVAFVEDPSRILRGLRLAARLGFRLTPEAEAQLAAALSPEVLKTASKSRLKDELLLALEEPSPQKVLELFDRYGVLEKVFGLRLDEPLWEAIRRLEAGRPEVAAPPEAYLYLLAAAAPDPEAFARRFGLPRTIAEGARRLGHPPADPERVRELGEAFVSAFLARYPDREAWLRVRRRHLRGRDLLALGMKPGPAVGRILREVAAARERGEVQSFEEELMLARKLMEAYGSS